MYCGNNANNRRVRSGELAIGTRFDCMRKGVGQGLYMPYDDSYLDEYVPIDDSRAYCGNQERLPAGYDRLGSLHHCFTKGVGVGRRQKAVKINTKLTDRTITRAELVVLCRELGIRGYAGQTKDRLLQLVLNHLNN